MWRFKYQAFHVNLSNVLGLASPFFKNFDAEPCGCPYLELIKSIISRSVTCQIYDAKHVSSGHLHHINSRFTMYFLSQLRSRGYGVTISRKPMGYFFHIARTHPIGSVDVPFGDHDL